MLFSLVSEESRATLGRFGFSDPLYTVEATVLLFVTPNSLENIQNFAVKLGLEIVHLFLVLATTKW